MDESEQPFLFENMDHLAKVLQTQKQRVQELKETEDVHRLPMLCVILDDIGLEATKYSRTLDNGFAMSRHYGVNWLCGSQLWRSLSVAVRKMQIFSQFIGCQRENFWPSLRKWLAAGSHRSNSRNSMNMRSAGTATAS